MAKMSIKPTRFLCVACRAPVTPSASKKTSTVVSKSLIWEQI